MNFRLEVLPEKKLVGKSLTMSFVNNKTFELWSGFMPHRKEIKNAIGADLFSLEIFNDLSFFKNFNPAAEFQKWAAVEVVDFTNVPDGMKTLTIPTGLYAVFIFKGTNADAPEFYRQIFSSWIPSSDYVLDNRPHFAVMGEKYKKDSADSEEEIWIPVK